MSLKTWPELHQWSVQHAGYFWASLAQFYKIQLEGPAYDLTTQRWFPEAQLNFAACLLQGRFLIDQSVYQASSPCLVSISEYGDRTQCSWIELEERVKKLAAYLKKVGVEPGDRVAAVVPNQIEAVISALACAYVGGVWTSCSPDFGVAALLDRFGQTTPKILIAVNGYSYKSKTISITDKIIELTNTIDTITNVVIIPFQSTQQPTGIKVDFDLDNLIYFEDIMSQAFEDIQPVLVEFNAPLYILYSSGTTGKPKCIVHSVGGTLLQHIKELGLHTDIKPGEKILYFSTCGWMMWNWLLSALSVGATPVLYDGNPLYPEPGRLLAVVESEEVEHFGASAKYYAALEQAGVVGEHYNLSKLRNFLSTGSPLLPEQFDYVYQKLKSDVRLASISGGTDIISCFALGNPWLAVRRGELQGPGLGMAVQVFNDDGESVVNAKGELVCTAPFPSQPIGFWQDNTGQKYHDAYFSRFDDVWAQGDFAIVTTFGGLIILGRSDAVLNPGGVRIGTAEIYRQVETIAGVVDAVAIGYDANGDEQVWLFLQLQDPTDFTAEFEQSVRQKIRDNTTPRHVPARIFCVPDLPRTRSGKLAELAVKKIVNNQQVNNLESLINPGCLDYFKNLK